MNLFNILPLIAAITIIVFNKPILNYMEQKCQREGKHFNRGKAFFISMLTVVILIIKAFLI